MQILIVIQTDANANYCQPTLKDARFSTQQEEQGLRFMVAMETQMHNTPFTSSV